MKKTILSALLFLGCGGYHAAGPVPGVRPDNRQYVASARALVNPTTNDYYCLLAGDHANSTVNFNQGSMQSPLAGVVKCTTTYDKIGVDAAQGLFNAYSTINPGTPTNLQVSDDLMTITCSVTGKSVNGTYQAVMSTGDAGNVADILGKVYIYDLSSDCSYDEFLAEMW